MGLKLSTAGNNLLQSINAHTEPPKPKFNKRGMQVPEPPPKPNTGRFRANVDMLKQAGMSNLKMPDGTSGATAMQGLAENAQANAMQKFVMDQQTKLNGQATLNATQFQTETTQLGMVRQGNEMQNKILKNGVEAAKNLI